MNLDLVKRGEFNGVKCDFYSGADDIWMTREQIGRALKYKDPRIAIAKIHIAHADRLDMFSTVTKTVTVEGGRTVEREVFLYSAKGVYEICRWSRQPKANAFMDWVWDVIEGLRTGNAKLYGEGMDQVVKRLVDAVDMLTSVTVELKQVLNSKDGLQLPTTLEAEADYMRLNRAEDPSDRRKSKFSISSVEKLKCYDEVVRMLMMRRHTLNEIVRYIESRGERCSKSSLDRYRNRKLRIGKVKDDGSFEVIEKTGRVIRFIANAKNETIYKIGY